MAIDGETVRVLLVEDDEDDYLITREMLAGQERCQFELDWCSEYGDALTQIRQRCHDVYLIDYRLGERNGLELVREGLASPQLPPTIMLTGESDHQIDLEASALGVTDFLLKRDIDAAGLERSIRYAIGHHQMILELARSEERYALVVRAANDGIWDWDLVHDRIYFSPRWHAMLGYQEQRDDCDPAAWFDIVYPDDLLRLRVAIDAHLAGQTPHLESEHRIRHADGSWRWVLARGLAIRGVDGRATRMAGSLSDVTERRNAERRLQHDALHDGLTGLPNRALFMDRVELALRRETRSSRHACAVMFIDIDHFKLINDSLSHGVGDQLLIALAGRLSSVLRPSDTVARIGGDEFTILLDGIGGEVDAKVVAERIESSLSHMFNIDGHELQVTASIGVSLSSPRMSSGDLLRNADIAMYEAKRRGRARCAMFDESMHRQVVARVSRESELRQAVEQSLLEVFYQPVIDLASGSIHSFEALARWPRDWQEVPPSEFIPIAEETGMIGALGLHVMRTSLAALARWRLSGLVSEEVRMGVNVSGRQLDDPALAAQVRAAVTAAGLPPAALVLEITESTLMHNPEHVRDVLCAIGGPGVGFHLDDFGTGYSSLSVLHQLPVDALKIDRSFVASLDSADGGSDVIVRSTVALAHSLGLQVIAEGIENPAQLKRLDALGCQSGQGYLFSRPLSTAMTERLLATWSSSRLAEIGARAAPR